MWNFSTEESDIYTQIENGYVATEDCVLQINIATGSKLNSGASVYINGCIALARSTNVENCSFRTADILRLRKGDVVTSKVTHQGTEDVSLGMYIRPIVK